jgi:solute carrier family 35 protein E3
MFEPKPLRHFDVFPITLAFRGFVIFDNLSLQYNSVGAYQLMKVMTTPVIVVLQYLLYGVKGASTASGVPCTRRRRSSLGHCERLFLQPFGGLICRTVILSTSFYQLFVKSKQDSLGNSWQSLKYQAPQAFVVTVLLTPLFDDVFGSNDGLIVYFTRGPSTGAIFMLILSSTPAFWVNLSIFRCRSDKPNCVQRLGPLQIVSHFDGRSPVQ